MSDLLQGVLAVAMVVVIGVWILRRFSGPLLRAEKPEDAVEEARAMAVDIGWDELDIERLDRKRAFK
ncbi:MAG TPA: hypothetical protein VHH55_09705, partial [Gaiellaceae bacterium]|nr:hypothetical protein [Gaiellaceae bacterium]